VRPISLVRVNFEAGADSAGKISRAYRDQIDRSFSARCLPPSTNSRAAENVEMDLRTRESRKSPSPRDKEEKSKSTLPRGGGFVRSAYAARIARPELSRRRSRDRSGVPLFNRNRGTTTRRDRTFVRGFPRSDRSLEKSRLSGRE